MPSPQIWLFYHETYSFGTEQVNEKWAFSQPSNCRIRNSTLPVRVLYLKWQKSTQAALRRRRICGKTWTSLGRINWVPRPCKENHSQDYLRTGPARTVRLPLTGTRPQSSPRDRAVGTGAPGKGKPFKTTRGEEFLLLLTLCILVMYSRPRMTLLELPISSLSLSARDSWSYALLFPCR